MSTWCDTSVPAVISHINCTDHEGVGGRQKLIIFTDETDPLYLSELFSGLKQLPQWGGRVVHGDPIIEKNAHHYNGAPDNYETYAAASNIISLAGQVFNVRCPLVCGERNADERGADRTDGNYRDYSPSHLATLTFVRRARELGFGMTQVRQLLALSDHADKPCGDVDLIVQAQLVEVERKIADLSRLREELAAMLRQCEGESIAECRVVESLGGRR